MLIIQKFHGLMDMCRGKCFLPLLSNLRLYTEIIIILMACVTQLMFAVFNMDEKLCHTQDSQFTLQLWLILFASTEITLLATNFACECCCSNSFIVSSSWVLAFVYVIFIFIGTSMAWYQCLVGDHISGPFFIGFSLLAGILISYRNVIVIDMLYNKRLLSEMHVNVSVYDAFRV